MTTKTTAAGPGRRGAEIDAIHRRLIPAIVPLATGVVLFAAPSARAADLDGHGLLDTRSAAFSYGFEAGTSSAAVELYGRRSSTLTPAQRAAHFVTNADEAIEGTGMLSIGGDASISRIRLDRLGEMSKFMGRRVEFRLWQRAKGTSALVSLGWVIGALDSQNTATLGAVSFQPTGRGTDDGWEEWTTGPVDYALGGVYAPTVISVRDAQLAAFQGPSSRDTSVFVWLDGITVDDLGEAAVPNAACTLPTEANVCGTYGACTFGRCVDAAATVGPKLENPSLRADYLARRIFEFGALEGGRAPIARMTAFAQSLTALQNEPSTVRFWSTIAAAVHDLGDPHASPPSTGGSMPLTAGVCLALGEADLLPSAGLAPLVFTTSTSSVGALLHPGDALVAIDGRTVSEWTVHAARFFSTFGDPEATILTHTPDLFAAAIATGAVLTFQRPTCATVSSTVSADVNPCPARQVERVTIDLGAMEQELWHGGVPNWLDGQSVQCDFRFRPAFAFPDGAAYEFAGQTTIDGVRFLQINGVPAPYGQQGQAWYTTVTEAFTPVPEKMILDERLGDGGVLDAVDHLSSYLVGPEDFDVIEMIPQLHQSFDEAILTRLRRCSPQSFDEACGDFIEQQIGTMNADHGAARNTRLAVLIGLDVSGNDYLTKLLTYRPRANTRIFGGAPTLGGFGVIWTLPAAPGETSGGSVQIMDTLFRESPDDLNQYFTTSTGIPPDIRVLQKQRDALRNVDTVIAAATAWLNQ